MHSLVVEDDPIVADMLGLTSDEAEYFKTTAKFMPCLWISICHVEMALNSLA